VFPVFLSADATRSTTPVAALAAPAALEATDPIVHVFAETDSQFARAEFENAIICFLIFVRKS
tara:strand:+ start:365 stop:553 length:189 start_codon:yes stop_codon:yes gene_type:complete